MDARAQTDLVSRMPLHTLEKVATRSFALLRQGRLEEAERLLEEIGAAARGSDETRVLELLARSERLALAGVAPMRRDVLGLGALVVLMASSLLLALPPRSRDAGRLDRPAAAPRSDSAALASGHPAAPAPRSAAPEHASAVHRGHAGHAAAR